LIAALAMPRATYGDPIRFLDRIHEVPLCSSAQLGRLSLSDIEKAENGSSKLTLPQVEAAFRDTAQEELRENLTAVQDALSMVAEIDAFLISTVGVERAPNFDPLQEELEDLRRRIGQFGKLEDGEMVSNPDHAEVASSGDESGVVGAAPLSSGQIQSREDVVRMLDRICDYYQQTEPSSPIPPLLRRAQRLTSMDFMDIIRDLCPDAEITVRNITGEPEAESE